MKLLTDIGMIQDLHYSNFSEELRGEKENKNVILIHQNGLTNINHSLTTPQLTREPVRKEDKPTPLTGFTV